MFKKILVANRGEIALRVIRACREMGISTVAVYSEADSDSLVTRLADERVCVGPSPSALSYLNIHNIISAAEVTAVDAIHPGYGFLAENSGFAQACLSSDIAFIGPTPDAIAMMGNKSAAKTAMSKAGVPVVPGSDGGVTPAEAEGEASSIGFPLMIKASSGGGGRGMRVANDMAELRESLPLAMAEAETAFGDPTVYLERLVTAPRHVEIQVIADTVGHVVHLGERDCSIQRRHQKLLEEAPSPAVDDDLRQRMGAAAVEAAKAVGYVSAGTVEFLLDESGAFYFMEMNTRIQVEHPVTEMITGVDLVKEQIRIAAGDVLSLSQEDVELNGHAIEFRVNAEDPEHDFLPGGGSLTAFNPPGGPGVRVDSHVYAGYEVPVFYDSLLAKLIVWGRNREEAVARGRRALDEFIVVGVPTTISFHQRVLEHPDFLSGEIRTDFLERQRLEAPA